MFKPEAIKSIRKYIRRKGYLLKLYKTPLSEAHLGKTVYEAAFGVLKETLLSGEDFHIRGFGNFKLSYVEPQTITNKFTGEEQDITERVRLRFYPAKFFLKKLNNRLL